MQQNQQNAFAFTKYSASSHVIVPFVNTEWRGVPAAWSAGLSVERGVQR